MPTRLDGIKPPAPSRDRAATIANPNDPSRISRYPSASTTKESRREMSRVFRSLPAWIGESKLDRTRPRPSQTHTPKRINRVVFRYGMSRGTSRFRGRHAVPRSTVDRIPPFPRPETMTGPRDTTAADKRWEPGGLPHRRAPGFPYRAMLPPTPDTRRGPHPGSPNPIPTLRCERMQRSPVPSRKPIDVAKRNRTCGEVSADLRRSGCGWRPAFARCEIDRARS